MVTTALTMVEIVFMLPRAGLLLHASIALFLPMMRMIGIPAIVRAITFLRYGVSAFPPSTTPGRLPQLHSMLVNGCNSVDIARASDVLCLCSPWMLSPMIILVGVKLHPSTVRALSCFPVGGISGKPTHLCIYIDCAGGKGDHCAAWAVAGFIFNGFSWSLNEYYTRRVAFTGDPDSSGAAKGASNTAELSGMAWAVPFELPSHSTPVTFRYGSEFAANTAKAFWDTSPSALVDVTRVLVNVLHAVSNSVFDNVAAHCGDPWNEMCDVLCVLPSSGV